MYYNSISNPHTDTHMNTIKNTIISLRYRVRAKDVALIYTCAIIDIALVAAVIGLICICF